VDSNARIPQHTDFLSLELKGELIDSILNEFTMPYVSIRNFDSFVALYSSRFYSLKSLRDLSCALNTCDFSVIASRRDMHTIIADFEAAGVAGDVLFSDTVRFPDGLTEVYLSSADPSVANWFSMVTAALSYRETTVAKDTLTSNGNGVSERVQVLKDSKDQDSTKRFEELKKVLTQMLGDPSKRLHRRSFETKVAGGWTNPPGP